MSAHGLAMAGKSLGPKFVLAAAGFGEAFEDVESFDDFDSAHAAAKELLASRRFSFVHITRSRKVIARYALGEEVA